MLQDEASNVLFAETSSDEDTPQNNNNKVLHLLTNALEHNPTHNNQHHAPSEGNFFPFRILNHNNNNNNNNMKPPTKNVLQEMEINEAKKKDYFVKKGAILTDSPLLSAINEKEFLKRQVEKEKEKKKREALFYLAQHDDDDLTRNPYSNNNKENDPEERKKKQKAVERTLKNMALLQDIQEIQQEEALRQQRVVNSAGAGTATVNVFQAVTEGPVFKKKKKTEKERIEKENRRKEREAAKKKEEEHNTNNNNNNNKREDNSLSSNPLWDSRLNRPDSNSNTELISKSSNALPSWNPIFVDEAEKKEKEETPTEKRKNSLPDNHSDVSSSPGLLKKNETFIFVDKAKTKSEEQPSGSHLRTSHSRLSSPSPSSHTTSNHNNNNNNINNSNKGKSSSSSREVSPSPSSSSATTMQLMWNDATGGIPSLRSHLYYELAGNGMLVDYHTYENLKTKREEEQYLRRLFDHKREQQMKRWERRFKNSKSTRDRSAAYLMNESGNRTNSAAATRRWGDVTGSSLFYRHFMFVTLSYLHRFQVFLISVATGAALLCLIMTTLHFGVTSDNNDSYDGTYSRVVLYTLLTYRFDTAFFMIVFLLMIIIQLMPMSCGFADRHWRVHRLRQQAQLTAHPYHTQNNNNNRQGKGLASATTLMDVRQTQMENYIHATELSRPRYREEQEEEEDNNGDEAGVKRAKKETNNNNAMNQNAIIKDANYCVEPTTALRMSAAGFRLHQKQKIERELRNEGDMGDIPFLPDEDQINRNNNNERKLSMSPGNDLFNNTNNSNSHTNNNNNNRLVSIPTSTLGSEHSSTTFPFNSSQNSNNNNVYSNSISNASRYGSEAIFHPYDTYRGNEKNDHNMNPNNHNNTNNSTLVEIGASHHGNRHKANNAFAFQSISSLWVHDKLSANNLFTKVFFDLENWFARHLLFFHRLNKINNSLYQTTLDKAQQKNQKKERENMNFLYYYVEGVYTLFSPSFWLMLVLFAFTFFEMQLLTGRTDAEIMSWENNNIEKKLYTIYILRAVILLIVWVLFLFF